MTTTIIASVVIFTIVISTLVVLINVANAKLVPTGAVKIDINNGEKVVDVQPGQTLLQALMEHDIYLPSACGGGGSCAMCKCGVSDGGGDVLPTEEGHLSRGEKKENVRLSCQVKVKNDMKVEVPEEVFGIKRYRCKVRSNDNVATFIKELVLEIQDGKTLEFKNGGYIQIEIPEYEAEFTDFDIEDEYREDWDKYNLWKYTMKNDEECFRAYSMANHPAEGQIVMLNVRIATPPPDAPDAPPGIASTYIFNLKPGDEVYVSGPYGEFFIQETEREMCFIGGGAGMAPMRSHLFHLFHTEKTHRKATFWYGARSVREMFYDDQFKDIEERFDNFDYHVALSDPLPTDNWDGYKGFIHQVLLDNYLSKHPDPGEVEYYLCGPPIMNKCVLEMLDDLGVEPEMIRLDDFGG